MPHPDRAPPYNRHEGRSRDRTQGGPIRRPHDRRLDTSPYSSGNINTSFLTLPPDTGWRRTNSDSALHQSTMQVMSYSSYLSNFKYKKISFCLYI